MRRLTLAGLLVGALLATVVATPASATYPGQEGRLAFVRANQIHTVASAGGAVTKLTSTGKSYRPKWSPDGKRIAFIRETAAGVKNVWLMKADGSAQTRVTRNPAWGATITAGPTWSPDGAWLAFAAQAPDQPAYLWKVKSTAIGSPGSGPIQLLGYDTCGESISEGCPDEEPAAAHSIAVVGPSLAWSPDGSRIAYISNNDGQFDDSISMYYVATGEARQFLVFGADCCGYADFSDLTWGPTGQFGLGENLDESYGENQWVEKIVYPADQCQVFRGICAEIPAGPVFVAAVGDKAPAPSPSNTRIAFVNATSGTSKIYVSTITGAQRQVVVTNGYQPDWQPLP